MDRRRVVAVTPVHNRRDDTLRCLESLQRADLSGLDLRIIVVDDGSTDGTAETISEKFPEVEVIKGDGNLWYSGGINAGFTRALELEPDFVLGFNDDSIFDSACISNLVACAERHPKSVVGALLLDWSEPHKVFQIAPKWETWSGGFRHWRHQTVWTVPRLPWEVELIVGNCFLVPTAAIRQVGLLDVKRFPQYGDAEYTPRLRRKGWRLLIEPKARLFCKPNTTVSGFRRLPLNRQFNELFLKPTGPFSVRRRFNASLYGAPNKILGMAAFFAFFVRAALGRSFEGPWGETSSEPPLAAIYASSVVEDVDVDGNTFVKPFSREGQTHI